MSDTPRIKLLDEIEERVQRTLKLMAPKSSEKTRIYIAPRPVTYAEVAHLISKAKGSLSASDEILYTEDKQLIHIVANRKLTYGFMNKKRQSLFEYLLEADGGYISTSALTSVSKSPNATALRKLVQGINTAIKQKLKLKGRLIVGRQGFGYALNKDFSIIKA